MKLTGTLESLSHKTDSNGNRHFALRYTDHITGHIVVGTVSGGDSNIHGILRHWNSSDDWDRSIIYRREEMGKREYNQLVKDWPYAGCTPADLAQFIRERLGKIEWQNHVLKELVKQEQMTEESLGDN